MAALSGQEIQMSFWDHLEELRWVIFKCLLVLVVTTLTCLAFTNPLWELMIYPLESLEVEVTIIEGGPVTAFVSRLKLSLLAGFVVGIPFILYFIWGFIAPGLRQHETRIAWVAIAAGTVFFVVGACFGYFLMFFGLAALERMGLAAAEPVWMLKDYMSFCFRFILAFGVVFEMPVVLVALARLGLVKADSLAKFRPYAVVAVFVLAAFLTPPDPFTQIMLGLPLLVLYELSIIMARLVEPKDAKEL
ncbi:MAG: twin-arginine translocase subunit TatC [Lentisphaeria bacterium]